MGKYLQILLTRAYELPPISNCDILHIHYGIDGWLEQCNDRETKAFRFISQKHIDSHTIMQIVEEMNDGWVPSKILLKDTVFSNNETIGIWNRTIMELPPLPSTQLASHEDTQPCLPSLKNQHPQTHAAKQPAHAAKQPALLPIPQKKQDAIQSHASYNKINPKNASNNYSSQPSSYNKSHKPLKSQYKNQSSPTPVTCKIVLHAAKLHQ